MTPGVHWSARGLGSAVVLTLVVFVGVGGLALGASRLMGGLRADAHGDLQRDVDRAARHAASRHRALVLEVVQLAQRAARSELAAQLGVLEERLPELYRVESRLYKEVPGPPDAPELTALRRARLAAMDDLVGGFARDYAARVSALRPAAQPGAAPLPLEAEGRALLEGCLAVGVNDCLYRAAFEPLRQVASDAREQAPDVLVVVDADGVGRADHTAPAWSDQKGVAAAIPVLAEALASRTVVHDFSTVPGRTGYFVLAAAPLLEGGALRGAVLVGVAVGGRRLARDAELVGRPLTWVINGSLGVVATTLEGPDLAALDDEATVTGREAMAGNVTTIPTVVASARRDDELARWDEVELQLWLVALGVALMLSAAVVLAARPAGRAASTAPGA